MSDEFLWRDESPFGVDTLHDDMRLEDVKRVHEGWFREGLGVDCLCCGRLVKPYARRINDQMVRALAVISRGPATSAEIIRKSGCRAGAGDHAKLRFWSLIREVRIPDEDPHWVITEPGRRFIAGETRIPKFALIYHDKVWGFSRETIHISDVAPFDLEELMAPLPEAAE